MGRFIAFTYGVAAYIVFFCTFLYAIGFVGDLVVPRSVDTGPAAPFGVAVVVDLALLGLFAVQHSVMARQGFKRWWTQFVPKPVERSTYVLFASLTLALLFWQWRPLPTVIWAVDGEVGKLALRALFFAGFSLVLLSTFAISHFDLFGLRQVYRNLRGAADRPVGFRTPVLYRLVRHPLYLGFLVAFWATPRMTLGHILFALATTGYILIAIQLEERDLVAAHGGAYERYRQSVPMLLPLGGVKAKSEADTTVT